MSTILDVDFDAGYNEEEDEDFEVTVEDLAEDDDDDSLALLKAQAEREKLKRQIKAKTTVGAEILSDDDDVDMFELPPEVDEDDLSHLEGIAAAPDAETARRLTVEEQVMAARMSKAFDDLNQGKDFSGSLASLCRTSSSKSKSKTGSRSSLGKRKASREEPAADSSNGSSTSTSSTADSSSAQPYPGPMSLAALSSGGGSKRKSKKPKTKKTLNSWELPAAKPVAVEEILETLVAEQQQQQEQEEEGAKSAENETTATPTVAVAPPPPTPADGLDGVEVLVADEDKYLVKDVAEFAGEKVEVVRELERGSAAERVFLRKKQKSKLERLVEGLEGGGAELSTIEKSSWDWQRDKREIGDAQELAQAAKDGFVAKQSFLAATEERERQRLKLQQRLAAGANR